MSVRLSCERVFVQGFCGSKTRTYTMYTDTILVRRRVDRFGKVGSSVCWDGRVLRTMHISKLYRLAARCYCGEHARV